MASAVIIHAAKVGHLNEMIASQVSNKDLKYEYALDGSGILKQGESLPVGGLGLKELVSQKLVDELGMEYLTG